MTRTVVWLSGCPALLGLLTASSASAQETYFYVPNAELSTQGSL